MSDLQKSVVTILATFCIAAGLVGLGYLWGGSAEKMKHRLAEANDRATASEGARKAERAAVNQVNKQAAVVEAKLDRARTTTKTLIEKVPVYVPYSNDVSDRISAGLAQLHDAAADGDVRLLSSSVAEPDGQVSAFTETDLAFAIAFNYGQFHECDARLTGLQEHERQRLAFEAEQRSKVEGGSQ